MIPTLRKRIAASRFGHWYRTRKRLRCEVQSSREWCGLDDLRALFYSQFVKPGDLVFDIGANVGNRTKIFRKLGATVVAVEPQPFCQRVLKNVFAEDPNVAIVPKAVGTKSGCAEIFICQSHVLSSLSREWMDNVTKSQRFGVTWDRREQCEITTLKLLIAEYGKPAFIKIDVEGYETEVIKGMADSVAALSFEYTPETREAAFECIEMLDAFGMNAFNYSDGESMALPAPWCDKDSLKRRLLAICDNRSFGDVYSRTDCSNSESGDV